ncbi:hypothetical protein THRCLA_22959 [Thraustotheca clavata]|uniref:Uncharacterized protein n=1 Tax=Thraustotheca clavata TaxID=74557 RepID=A0A1V9YLG8_9STRA|nr:hypothetical protein THRCLA_22959 [Thraustotheca clavata]
MIEEIYSQELEYYKDRGLHYCNAILDKIDQVYNENTDLQFAIDCLSDLIIVDLLKYSSSHQDQRDLHIKPCCLQTVLALIDRLSKVPTVPSEEETLQLFNSTFFALVVIAMGTDSKITNLGSNSE